METDSHVGHIVPQVFQLPVPVRIIGHADDVKINTVRFDIGKPPAVKIVVRTEIEMEDDPRIRHDLPDALRSCLQQEGHIFYIVRFPIRPEQTVRDLVPDLHMGWDKIFILQRVEDTLRILIYLFPQLLACILFPCLRLRLFCRIRPEITVLKIQHEHHPCIDHPVCQFYGSCYIICTASIRDSVIRIGIHPEPEPDKVGTAFLQKLKQVCLSAIKEIFSPQALQSFCEGNIHSFVKAHFSPFVNVLFFIR